MNKDLFKPLEDLAGDIAYYYQDLAGGETLQFHEERPLIAASVIKLFIMAEAFRQFEAGECDPDEPIRVDPSDKCPSCGVLTYLHDGIVLPIRDLVTLMIIVSDNTATNLLIDRLGIDSINAFIDTSGFSSTRLRRKLFDMKGAANGINNQITAGDTGLFFSRLYHGTLVSSRSDAEMLGILKNQRLNGKFPFRIPERCLIAHKTGEDDYVTHDAGIFFTKKPFILCVCSNNVDVPQVERTMQDLAFELYRRSGGECES